LEALYKGVHAKPAKVNTRKGRQEMHTLYDYNWMMSFASLKQKALHPFSTVIFAFIACPFRSGGREKIPEAS
jgi:hypothetical protein